MQFVLSVEVSIFEKRLSQSMIYLIIFVLVLLLILSSIYFPYFLLKPYLKSAKGRSTVFKGFLILAALSGIGYAFAKYLMQEPAYFEQGIEQLHKSKYIKEHIGDFSSYTYYSSKLLKEPGNPASFQVEIPGDSIILFLTCTMSKTENKWQLVGIQQDSIVIKQ